MMPTSNNNLLDESECEQLGASESDAKLCSVEAKAAISEVAFGVKEIQMASDALPCTDSLAYLNLTTLEGESMCVEISVKGFYPVGRRYNQTEPDPKENNNDEVPEYYETVYALLSARSRLFRDQFSKRLSDRLRELDNRKSLELS
ncbi:GSK3-beta interaction protein [Fasciola gigantica]|uniref:GSK3-beta interaction protein n=1 Tax=Fasciola gigantica TaxID=46835 RepID=A0A504Z968_FASGI|nr:GSK3-beta interaction protein [Fasciola gigantica]